MLVVTRDQLHRAVVKGAIEKSLREKFYAANGFIDYPAAVSIRDEAVAICDGLDAATFAIVHDKIMDAFTNAPRKCPACNGRGSYEKMVYGMVRNCRCKVCRGEQFLVD